jgi:hypothetical protein
MIWGWYYLNPYQGSLVQGCHFLRSYELAQIFDARINTNFYSLVPAQHLVFLVLRHPCDVSGVCQNKETRDCMEYDISRVLYCTSNFMGVKVSTCMVLCTLYSMFCFAKHMSCSAKKKEKATVSELTPTSAPWRMDGKWSGDRFLLGSSSLAS